MLVNKSSLVMKSAKMWKNVLTNVLVKKNVPQLTKLDKLAKCSEING